jgi:hypothetical protein
MEVRLDAACSRNGHGRFGFNLRRREVEAGLEVVILICT